jgi:hypothetical protein
MTETHVVSGNTPAIFNKNLQAQLKKPGWKIHENSGMVVLKGAQLVILTIKETKSDDPQ